MSYYAALQWLQVDLEYFLYRGLVCTTYTYYTERYRDF